MSWSFNFSACELRGKLEKNYWKSHSVALVAAPKSRNFFQLTILMCFSRLLWTQQLRIKLYNRLTISIWTFLLEAGKFFKDFHSASAIFVKIFFFARCFAFGMFKNISVHASIDDREEEVSRSRRLWFYFYFLVFSLTPDSNSLDVWRLEASCMKQRTFDSKFRQSVRVRWRLVGAREGERDLKENSWAFTNTSTRTGRFSIIIIWWITGRRMESFRITLRIRRRTACLNQLELWITRRLVECQQRN